jgi:predicted nuclease with TOPRIM domain
MAFKRARSFTDLEKEHNELQQGIKESKEAYEVAKNAHDIKEAEVKEHTERIKIQIRKLQAQLEQYLADADPELRNLQNHYSVQSASVRNCEQEFRNFNNKLRVSRLTIEKAGSACSIQN